MKQNLYPNKIGNYLLKEKIGHGSSSVVVRCLHIQSNLEYACKIFAKNSFHHPRQIQQFRDEVAHMKQFSHPNIVAFKELLEDSINYYLIEEYCCGGDISAYLQNAKPFTEDEAAQIFSQLINVLDYVHKKHIAHRDIKLENILLDSEMNCKVGDFGLSSICNDGQLRETICGSFYYVAPEVLSGSKYDPYKADSWSSGIVLYILLTKRFPWKTVDQNRALLLKELQTEKLEIPSDISKECADMLKRLCEVDPEKRMSISDAIHHDFVKNRAKITKRHSHLVSLKELKLPHRHKPKSETGMLANSSPCMLTKYKESDTSITELLKQANRPIPKKRKRTISSTKHIIVIPKTMHVKYRSHSPVQESPLFLPGWQAK